MSCVAVSGMLERVQLAGSSMAGDAVEPWWGSGSVAVAHCHVPLSGSVGSWSGRGPLSGGFAWVRVPSCSSRLSRASSACALGGMVRVDGLRMMCVGLVESGRVVPIMWVPAKRGRPKQEVSW